MFLGRAFMAGSMPGLMCRAAHLRWRLGRCVCTLLLRRRLLTVVIVSIAGMTTAGAAPPSSTDPALVAALAQGGLMDKEAAVKRLAASGNPRAAAVLQALLDGSLHLRTSDAALVIALDEQDPAAVLLARDGAAQPAVPRDALEPVMINNKLRRILREQIAALTLASPDADVRIAAVRAMFKNPDDEAVERLRAMRASEQSGAVLESIGAVLALNDLASGDAARQAAAITVLEGRLEPEVENALLASTQDESATPEVRVLAQRALRAISNVRDRYEMLNQLYFGVSLGSVLLLAAVGLAITFGVMGVINMAHGELIMLGAYTTYVVQLLLPNHIDISLFVAIPAAFLVSGLFGIAIERGVIQFLHGRPLETLLATFGISLVLQQLVRSVFSPLNRSVQTPSWMSGSVQINEALSLTYNRLYVIAFALLVFALLSYVMRSTTMGLWIRAVSQNRQMARALGVRADRTDALAFGLGSGVAGVAGVALSQLTNVGPNLGQSYIIDSFLVVVFGGVGNLWGTLVAAMTLGIANKVLEPQVGSVLASILVLVAIILFIQKRPRGLFPQKGRAVES